GAPEVSEACRHSRQRSHRRLPGHHRRAVLRRDPARHDDESRWSRSNRRVSPSFSNALWERVRVRAQQIRNPNLNSEMPATPTITAPRVQRTVRFLLPWRGRLPSTIDNRLDLGVQQLLVQRRIAVWADQPQAVAPVSELNRFRQKKRE